ACANVSMGLAAACCCNRPVRAAPACWPRCRCGRQPRANRWRRPSPPPPRAERPGYCGRRGRLWSLAHHVHHLPPPVIRVLLAEDQAMVRGALAALLGMEADIEAAGVAADGEEAWRELQRLQPDLLVTDIEMPGLGGLDLAARIARHELPVKVVIVTTFARAGFL